MHFKWRHTLPCVPMLIKSLQFILIYQPKGVKENVLIGFKKSSRCEQHECGNVLCVILLKLSLRCFSKKILGTWRVNIKTLSRANIFLFHYYSRKQAFFKKKRNGWNLKPAQRKVGKFSSSIWVHSLFSRVFPYNIFITVEFPSQWISSWIRLALFWLCSVELHDTQEKMKALLVNFQAMEKEKKIGDISLQQRDDEIARLTTLNRYDMRFK